MSRDWVGQWVAPLALLTLPGCVTLLPERMQMQAIGRYGELVEYEERQAAALPRVSTETLYDLCFSYSKVKNYRKLFECADQMEKQVAQGDREVFAPSTRRGGWGGGVVRVGRSDGSPYPWMLRSEALIDLGDYPRALAEARTALALCARVESTFGGFERTDCHVTALGLLGLSSALDKDAATAGKARADLQAYPLGLYGIALTSQAKSLAIARIEVALGRYREALEHLGDPWAAGRFLANLFVGSVGASTDIFASLQMPFEYVRARCLLGTEQYAAARTALDSLLGYPQIPDNGEIYWMALHDRGRIAERDGDIARAIELYRKAVEVIERQRSTISSEASKIGYVGDKQAVYRHLVSALLGKGEHAAAFKFVERSKSRALVDMLASKQDFAVATADPAKVRQLLDLAAHAEARALMQEPAGKTSSPRSAATGGSRELREAAPELASLVSVTAVAAGEIQSVIPADETLVEYYQGGDELVAFVVSARGLSAIRLDGRGLVEDIGLFRKQLMDVSSQDYSGTSRKLHARLFAPLAGRIATHKLLVVAHGPLHYLPFNALHDGTAYLIERHSVRLLPSASVLRYLRSQPVAKPGGILAFGNPDLDDPRLDLAFAQAEVAAITRDRPDSRALVRKDASESAFRQYAGGFRYVHFATHGEFNAEAPLKSTLLLAKDPKGDGHLTVDKLYSLRLDADLVTLSACETGLGRVASGDDVVGLTRGFLYAGSRSIVASLWQVDDEATSYLMTRFYDGLRQRDKREALRQAQKGAMARYPHPFFWAAFQLTGSAE